MSDTITGAAHAVTPDLIEGYEAVAESLNLEHLIPATQERAVTLRGGARRSGSMKALFSSATNAQYLFADLRAAATLALTSTSISYIAMTFVVPQGGRSRIYLSASRRLWVVEFDFQEVEP